MVNVAICHISIALNIGFAVTKALEIQNSTENADSEGLKSEFCFLHKLFDFTNHLREIYKIQ